MSRRLPERISPASIARQARALTGEVELEGMKRLAACVDELSGNGQLALEFDMIDDSVPVAEGDIRATVTMTCQRCLLPVDLELCAPVRVAFVTEPDVTVDARYEMVEMQGEELELAGLVEDELILSLPIAPRHAEEHCQPAASPVDNEPENDPEDHPFSELSKLKRFNRG